MGGIQRLQVATMENSIVEIATIEIGSIEIATMEDSVTWKLWQWWKIRNESFEQFKLENSIMEIANDLIIYLVLTKNYLIEWMIDEKEKRK